jgi:glutamate racemase
MPSLAINNRPVAFLDSGVGGIPYLVTLRKKLPRENYIYLADRKNFPYGEKSVDQLRDIVKESVQKLIDVHNPKMIILACNTASVSTLDDIRAWVNIPIVGVVPAIKPAALLSGKRTIGVLATEGTVHAPYLDQLIEKFADSCHVVRAAAGDVVDFVENKLLLSTREEQNRLIAPAIDIFIKEGVDTIVLGCTHFTYLEENIRHLSKGTILPVDSREGVANQAVKVLNGRNEIRSKGEGLSLFFSTEPRDDSYYHRLGESFFLDYRGVLETEKKVGTA